MVGVYTVEWRLFIPEVYRNQGQKIYKGQHLMDVYIEIARHFLTRNRTLNLRELRDIRESTHRIRLVMTNQHPDCTSIG